MSVLTYAVAKVVLFTVSVSPVDKVQEAEKKFTENNLVTKTSFKCFKHLPVLKSHSWTGHGDEGFRRLSVEL